jgi:hypothetical protein
LLRCEQERDYLGINLKRKHFRHNVVGINNISYGLYKLLRIKMIGIIFGLDLQKIKKSVSMPLLSTKELN